MTDGVVDVSTSATFSTSSTPLIYCGGCGCGERERLIVGNVMVVLDSHHAVYRKAVGDTEWREKGT